MAIWPVALQAGLVAAGVAGIIGAVAGAVLMVVPRDLLQRPSRLRRVLFEMDLGDPFNRSYAIERRVYRRHRIAGSAVLAGAAALVALLWYLGHEGRVSGEIRQVLGAFGLRTMTVVAWTIAAGLVLAGTCLLVRPSVLKGIEAAANRWIEPPKTPRHLFVSEWASRSPRLAGAILLLAGVACLRPF